MSTIRVAVVGCGSVSEKYIPNLQGSPHVEVVALCDNLRERASKLAKKFGVVGVYDDLDRMLAEVDFALLVNLTPMPLHAPFNRKGLEAGRHIWCEKPIATNLADAHALLELAHSRQLGLYCAPNSPTSPAFREIAGLLATDKLGKVAVAHGIYGWAGPEWSGTAWYYRKGGGALFDLGVYNVTTLTGLLGPARSVVAMAGSAIDERIIDGETVKVEAEDNVALVLDHGEAVYSVIQTGFVYSVQREDWTIQLIGTNGAVTMGGYDWEPRDVQVYHGVNRPQGQWEVHPQDQQAYHWEGGARYIAECLATGQKPLLSGEYALHVLEVMLAALESAQTGQRIQIASSFSWPLIG